MTRIWLILFVVLLAACGSASKKSEATLLETTLTGYAKVLRWGEVEQWVVFVDPEVLEAHPISPLDLERFRQVEIAGYREQPAIMIDDTHATQIVQIELINKHTQAVRSIVDRQIWRYDPEKEHWWLTSGLPRIATEN